MNKCLIVCFGFLYFCVGANSQNVPDSLLGAYLVKIGEIDSAINQSTLRGKKTEVITNFFADKKDLFSLDNNIKLQLYKFGSFTSHVKPHLAIVRVDKNTEHLFMDCVNIQADLDKLFAFINPYLDLMTSGKESLKLHIIKSIIREYP